MTIGIGYIMYSGYYDFYTVYLVRNVTTVDYFVILYIVINFTVIY